MSSLSDDDDLGWCNSWPATVWHCFLKGKEILDCSAAALGEIVVILSDTFFLNSTLGTRLCFHKESNKEWQDVEDFARAEGCDNEEEIQMGTHKVHSFQTLLKNFRTSQT